MFEFVPLEILTIIFENIEDYCSLVSLCLVCKEFYALIKDQRWLAKFYYKTDFLVARKAMLIDNQPHTDIQYPTTPYAGLYIDVKETFYSHLHRQFVACQRVIHMDKDNDLKINGQIVCTIPISTSWIDVKFALLLQSHVVVVHRLRHCHFALQIFDIRTLRCETALSFRFTPEQFENIEHSHLYTHKHFVFFVNAAYKRIWLFEFNFVTKQSQHHEIPVANPCSGWGNGVDPCYSTYNAVDDEHIYLWQYAHILPGKRDPKSLMLTKINHRQKTLEQFYLHTFSEGVSSSSLELSCYTSTTFHFKQPDMKPLHYVDLPCEKHIPQL